MNKIIQICTWWFDNSRLFALCDNGKIYTTIPEMWNWWDKIEDITQF